jgi:hypothetical protein
MIMKKYLSIIVTIIMMFGSTKISAQVKIGDNPTTVNSGSLLELESTNKGLLMPRLADTTSISNPPQGMFMFNNNDTSLYFRRLGGWRRLSIGDDNYWKGIGFDIGLPVDRIYTQFPVTISMLGNPPLGMHAPFQTRGMIGNTLAMFGNGAPDNTAGISLVGNWPGIFFNSYYNSGNTNMAPGYSGNISLDPNAGNYWFSFNNNATSPNTKVNQATKMYLSKDGKLGLNTTISNRAWMEEQGAVNNASAIFGGEGAGVAIEEHFPSIGFNSYYNGSGYSSIGAGYGGEIGIDQNNGDFYVTTTKGNVGTANNIYAGYVRTFNVAPSGDVGINTLTPGSQLEIAQPNNTISPSNGLTFTSYDGSHTPAVFGGYNLSVYTGVLNGNSFEGSYLVFQAGAPEGSYSVEANIDYSGSYHQTSDRRFKKDIASLDQKDMLQKLLSLKPSNYHFINQNTNTPKSYGFIAQDVEQVFPEFVNTIQDKKMLAYSSFIPVIVAAMQEQQQEIETLKTQNPIAPSVQTENNDLKSQVSTLTDMVKQLQQKVDALEKQGK